MEFDDWPDVIPYVIGAIVIVVVCCCCAKALGISGNFLEGIFND
jgi:hypothetical protein